MAHNISLQAKTYAVLFVVVAEDGKSSVLSELCGLHNYFIIDSLLHNDRLCIARTDLPSHHTVVLCCCC